MPYVDQKIRDLYKDSIEHFESFHATKCTAGEFTYLITAFCHSWIKKHRWCYLTFCITVGVLVCTVLELYRKVISRYEDKKYIESGPVSDLDSKTLDDVR